MAYQNVGSPRFYINGLEWAMSNGIEIFRVEGTPDWDQYESMSNLSYLDYDMFRTLPVTPTYTNDIPYMFRWDIENITGVYDHPDDDGQAGGEQWGNFTAILGHESDYNFILNPEPWYILGQNEPIVNWNPADTGYKGFSLIKHKGSIARIEIRHPDNGDLAVIPIGSIVCGSYYDIPHSPDLKLTMTREMDGVKSVRTRGGGDLIKHQYTKAPNWGTYPAWELATQTAANAPLSRGGRRTWDLSFNFLQDSDMFPEISSLDPFEYTIDGDTFDPDVSSDWNAFDRKTIQLQHTFYSQVIHRTNGGQLPFIFQADRNNNQPDQFAICKFDMQSFQFKQVANGVYNIKLKIREIW